MSLKPIKEFMNLFKVVTAILAVVFTANMIHAEAFVHEVMMMDGEVQKPYEGADGKPSHAKKTHVLDMGCSEYLDGMVNMHKINPEIKGPGTLWQGKDKEGLDVSVVTHIVYNKEINLILRRADDPAKLGRFW